MIINLSHNPAEALSYLHAAVSHDTEELLLDISGACEEQTLCTRISARELDTEHNLEKQALESYTRFSAEASVCSFSSYPMRSLQIMGFPLFWLTSLSIKHENYHWGQTVFFLRELMMQKPEFFLEHDRHLLIVPADFDVAIPFLSHLFSSILGTKVEFLGAQKPSVSAFTWIKSFLRLFMDYVKYGLFSKAISSLKRGKNVDTHRFLHIFACMDDAFLKGQQEADADMGALVQHCHGLKQNPLILPISFQLSAYKSFDLAHSDKSLYASFPSVTQVLGIFIHACISSIKISRISKNTLNIGGIEVPASLLQLELWQAMGYLPFVFQYLWLVNYFRQLPNPAAIYYSDEFYRPGRMISLAIRNSGNSHIKGYGVQHGLFFHGHTVYCLKEVELDTDASGLRGMPIPDTFLVWGNFFKNYFLSNNSLPSTYAKVTGNLKYIQAQKSNPVSVKGSADQELKILWCMSLYKYAISEYKLILSVLETIPNIRLFIRHHPVNPIPEDSMSQLLDERFADITQTDTSANLKQALHACDLVLSTSVSTTFLDALLAGKHSCRMHSTQTSPNVRSIKNVALLHDIYTAEDLAKAVQAAKNPDSDLQDITELCYLEPDRWTQIFTQEHAPSLLT